MLSICCITVCFQTRFDLLFFISLTCITPLLYVWLIVVYLHVISILSIPASVFDSYYWRVTFAQVSERKALKFETNPTHIRPTSHPSSIGDESPIPIHLVQKCWRRVLVKVLVWRHDSDFCWMTAQAPDCLFLMK